MVQAVQEKVKIDWRRSGVRIDLDEFTGSGAMLVLFRRKRMWMINSLKVRREYRTTGVGSRLLQMMCDELWKREALPIVLECHPYDGTRLSWLKAWYKRRGFASVRGTRGLYRMRRPPRGMETRVSVAERSGALDEALAEFE
jgi:GNAT superfamily N-acetyltransferase